MRWLFIAVAMLALCGFTPAPAFGHQAAAVLVVTIRDVRNAGVAGVTVLVRDQGGQQVIGQGVTDTAGHVRIDRVTAPTVRVAVRGALPGGTPLVQPGDDAQGILVSLNGPSVRVQLRVEDEGTVIPDPAMVALDTVDASVGDSRPTPIVPILISPVPTTAGASAAPAPDVPAPTGNNGLVVVIVILVIIVILMVVFGTEQRVP